MADSELTLVPYLHFQGECEEALNHYVAYLGGDVEGIQRYDNPGMEMEIPPDYQSNVLHARYTFRGNLLMASDVFPGQGVSSGSRVELVLELEDEADARRIFEGLSDGGRVTMPLEKQFWGALYGKLVDRFGIAWMVNCKLD